MSFFEMNITNNYFNGPVTNNNNHGNAAPHPESPDHSGHKKRQWWSGIAAQLLKAILPWLWENFICKWLATMMPLCLLRAGMGAEDAISWVNGLVSLLTVIITNLLK